MKGKIKALLASAALTAFALGAQTLPIPGLAVTVQASTDTYTVSVASGYLALRSAQAYDDRNEIGQLYNGDTVEVQQYGGGDYWWVFSPKYNRSGYVNKNYLTYSGGTTVTGTTYTVSVASGYLALRTAKAYDSRNEIGELYSGDTVQVQDASDATYWYVYSPKYGKYGYVNRNYLVGAGSVKTSSGTTYTVSVSKGYLALRTAKAYDSRNEIGELYSGDTVQVQDTSDATYWYVYSPKYGKYGYVNRNYLIGAGSSTVSVSGPAYTVSVASGYLALRTAKAYDDRNEIGQLYSGDTVTVQDSSDATYWYVYSPKYGKYGYVNRNYLIGSGSSASAKAVSGPTYTVSVASGYLALRTAKAYDDRNEIGQLYSGDTVTLQDSSDATYWYVYSPKYGKYGYVNRNYLR